MRKIFLVVSFVAIIMVFAACGKSEMNKSNIKDDEVSDMVGVQIANPWITVTSGELEEKTGFAFGVPQGAADLVYQWCEALALAEMRFTLDGIEYVARVRVSDEFTDISGAYYDWDNGKTESVNVLGVDAELLTLESEGKLICLFRYYDAGSGHMLSALSTGTSAMNTDCLAAVFGAFGSN